MKFKLIGIDYGEVNVGLAIATTELAEPVRVVDKKEAMGVIQAMVDGQKSDAIVLGVSEGKMAQKTLEFGRQLKLFSGKPVYLQDETLSSKSTRKKMAEGTVGRVRREGLTDHYVAAEILQAFIDENLPLEDLPNLGKIE